MQNASECPSKKKKEQVEEASRRALSQGARDCEANKCCRSVLDFPGKMLGGQSRPIHNHSWLQTCRHCCFPATSLPRVLLLFSASLPKSLDSNVERAARPHEPCMPHLAMQAFRELKHSFRLRWWGGGGQETATGQGLRHPSRNKECLSFLAADMSSLLLPSNVPAQSSPPFFSQLAKKPRLQRREGG